MSAPCKPTAGFWIVVVVVVLFVGYPLSEPWAFVFWQRYDPKGMWYGVYRPLGFGLVKSPLIVMRWFNDYSDWCLRICDY